MTPREIRSRNDPEGDPTQTSPDACNIVVELIHRVIALPIPNREETVDPICRNGGHSVLRFSFVVVLMNLITI